MTDRDDSLKREANLLQKLMTIRKAICKITIENIYEKRKTSFSNIPRLTIRKHHTEWE